MNSRKIYFLHVLKVHCKSRAEVCVRGNSAPSVTQGSRLMEAPPSVAATSRTQDCSGLLIRKQRHWMSHLLFSASMLWLSNDQCHFCSHPIGLQQSHGPTPPQRAGWSHLLQACKDRRTRYWRALAILKHNAHAFVLGMDYSLFIT